jgi:NADH-quinone oxidoreductase subunit J
MDLRAFLFWSFALLTGVSAVAVVVSQNIVRAATWLLFALAGTAGIFFLLGADFVGATQLLVYVGGTLVLVVFGVMLTAQKPFISMKIGAGEWLIGLAVGLMLYACLALVLLDVPAPNPEGKPSGLASSVVLGQALLGFPEATPAAALTGKPGPKTERRQVAYLLPFEIISVHLLVVLVGAAYLARAKRRAGANKP